MLVVIEDAMNRLSRRKVSQIIRAIGYLTGTYFAFEFNLCVGIGVIIIMHYSTKLWGETYNRIHLNRRKAGYQSFAMAVGVVALLIGVFFHDVL